MKISPYRTADSGINVAGIPASIQMTIRYADPAFENMQRAVDKLGEIFEKNR